MRQQHNDNKIRRAQELAWKLTRVRLKMAVLRRGWRNCPVSDCRRDRACMGDELPCLMTPPDPAVKWTREQIEAWQALLRERKECRADLDRAAMDLAALGLM